MSRGRIAKAQKVVVYGPEGVGKTTFCMRFPNPLFIDTEGSTDGYDLNRLTPPAKSWSALLDAVRQVKSGSFPISTLVIDTADWAERMCIESVCAQRKWESIESPGYGKGYTYVVEEFGKLLDLLSDVTEAGINAVLTCHAAIRKFEQPDEAASYDRWCLKLVDATKMSNSAKVKEWADAVLFANYKTVVELVGEGKSAKGKARGGQTRVVHTQHHACWDAKNRWGLPEEVPMEYASIAAHIPDMRASAPNASTRPSVAPEESARPPRPVQTVVFNQDGTVASNTVHAPADRLRAGLPDYWAPALQLMDGIGATVDEIKAVASDVKGFFSADTPPSNYPKEFVDGCIVAQWDAWRREIETLRVNSEKVPF